ncbi:hypothetical protein [Peterkaempfera sp. SMS 1(5)a]|uniref:hypothetical protein n=1 Tax=Peterkaempfera podocarpi TaxID=3232308 RepID=UPI00367302B3
MTADDPGLVPDWPWPAVQIMADGRVEVDGIAVPVPEGLDADGVRRWAVAHAARQYARIGRPIRVTAIDPDGTRRPLIVHPDGAVLQALEPEPPHRTGHRLRPVGRPEGSGRGTSRSRRLTGAAFLVSGVLGLALVALVAAPGAHHLGQASQGPAFPPRATPPLPNLSPPALRPEPEGAPTPTTTSAGEPDLLPSAAPSPQVTSMQPADRAPSIPEVPHPVQRHHALKHRTPERLRFQIPKGSKGFRFTVPKGSCHALAKEGGLPGRLFTACRSLFE